VGRSPQGLVYDRHRNLAGLVRAIGPKPPRPPMTIRAFGLGPCSPYGVRRALCSYAAGSVGSDEPLASRPDLIAALPHSKLVAGLIRAHVDLAAQPQPGRLPPRHPPVRRATRSWRRRRDRLRPADPDYNGGTGGGDYEGITATPAASSVVSKTKLNGIPSLTLRPSGFDRRYVNVPGQTFQDSGSADCH
jgi:hypothetical protein